MAKVIYRPNLLEGKELSYFLQVSTIQEALFKMASLSPEFSKLLELGGNYIFIIAVNDLEVPVEMWGKYPIRENDEIIISHDVGLEGFFVGLGFAAATAATLSTITVGLILNAAIYALNYFTRPKPPGYSGGDFTSTSPTYSWSGIVLKS